MALTSHLRRRAGTYYARLAIPLDLQPILGKTDREKSLRTKDPKEAKRRLTGVLAAWHAEFEDARRRREITDDNKADAVWKHYTGTLDRDAQNRLLMPTSADIDAATEQAVERVQREGIDMRDPLAALDVALDVMVLKQRRALDAQARRTKLDAMRKHLAEGETALINHEVDAYATDNGLVIDPLSPDRGDLAGKMMRAEIEALERTLERDRGDYTGTPRDPIVKPVTGTAREQAKPGETIMELFDAYARENRKGVKPDTLSQSRAAVQNFVGLVGRGFPATKIDKKAVREWKAILLQLPVRAGDTKAFQGMTPREIVKANEKIGKPTISAKTINRYLAGLGAFCDWLSDNDYIVANPVIGFYQEIDRQKRTTLPFTVEQMNVVFASPLFTGVLSADSWDRAKPGNVQIRDHRYWVPLVMAFSGARPAEIAQLDVADVRQEHGQWIMHVTDDGDEVKTVKTKGSMRVIPVHPELIRLGFIKHRDAMQKAGLTRLFPEATRNSRGQMIAEFSRDFGRYLERIGVKDGKGLSLYSFRHGAADAFRRAGYLNEQFGMILGHAKRDMTGQYGIVPQGILQHRVELVNSISYPGLKINHLY